MTRRRPCCTTTTNPTSQRCAQMMAIGERVYATSNGARHPSAMFDPPLGPAVYPRTVAPNRRPYRTSDGYIAALIYNDKHWNTFMDAVRPPWASDLYATLERRARQIDTVYALLAETLAQRATQEWLELFRELEIPAASLSGPGTLFDDPHLNTIGFFETVDTPHGPVRFPVCPPGFPEHPVVSPVPLPSWAPTPPTCSKNSD
jgi:crotonobetainyl-CoA:carnitine CoA-transferase CaiB-like acyl-CoA transferase